MLPLLALQFVGTVFLWADYRVPMAPMRAELQRICAAAPEWDGRVALLQVVDSNERAIQLRALVSSADSSKNWDLRCGVREALLDFIQREHRAALPRLHTLMETADEDAAPEPPDAKLAVQDTGRGASSSIQQSEHAGKHAPEGTRKSAEARTSRLTAQVDCPPAAPPATAEASRRE